MTITNPFPPGHCRLVLHPGFTAEFQNTPSLLVQEVIQTIRSHLHCPWKQRRRNGNQYRFEYRVEYYGVIDGSSICIPQGLVPRVLAALRKHGIYPVIEDRRLPSMFGKLGSYSEIGVGASVEDIAYDQLRNNSVARIAVKNKQDEIRLISDICKKSPNGIVFIQNTFRSHYGFLQARDLKDLLDEPIQSPHEPVRNPNARIYLIGRSIQSYYRCGCRPDLIIVVNAEDDLREIAVKMEDLQTRHVPFGYMVRRKAGLCPQTALALDWSCSRNREDEWTLESLYGPVIRQLDRASNLHVMMVHSRINYQIHIADAIDMKRRMYWSNRTRNQEIAQLANAVNNGSIMPFGWGTIQRHLEPYQDSRCRIAVIVENVEHARMLVEFLPDWSIRSQTDAGKDDQRSIVTIPFLQTTSHAASIWIRATGGTDPIGPLGQRLTSLVSMPASPASNPTPTLLIDLFDDDQGSAAFQSRTRLKNYQHSGCQLTEINFLSDQNLCRRFCHRRRRGSRAQAPGERAGHRSNARANGPRETVTHPIEEPHME